MESGPKISPLGTPLIPTTYTGYVIIWKIEYNFVIPWFGTYYNEILLYFTFCIRIYVIYKFYLRSSNRNRIVVFEQIPSQTRNTEHICHAYVSFGPVSSSDVDPLFYIFSFYQHSEQNQMIFIYCFSTLLSFRNV